MSARDRIFSRIKAAREHSGVAYAPQRDALETVGEDFENPVRQFVELAKENDATVEELTSGDLIEDAIREYLDRADYQGAVMFGDGLHQLSAQPGFAAASSATLVNDGMAYADTAYAGLAEAGAIVTLSPAEGKPEYAFLARIHIAVLSKSLILRDMETLWTRLRKDSPGQMPRAINVIVGPSRTADLGVPAKLGAHGPSAVHILLVDE